MVALLLARIIIEIYQRNVENKYDVNAFERNDYNKQVKKIKNVTRKDCYHASKFTHDSLSELAELVSRGDEKGLFNTCLPPAIEQTVKFENLEFCKNKDTYNADYFQFIFKIVLNHFRNLITIRKIEKKLFDKNEKY